MVAGRRFRAVMVKRSAADLETLRGLMDAGTLKSVIDRRYGLSEAGAAVGYLEEGHARGKVVVIPSR